MMDFLGSPSSRNKNPTVPAQKRSVGNLKKDLWFCVREGSLADVETALVLLKKHGGSINSRNAFGLTPLHIATWRNHISIVRKLIAAGADPDVRDGESGWSSLHRALHFGHLAVANVLLNSGASISLEDTKSRTPIDLLSGPVLQALGSGSNADTICIGTEVFTWGSGANYQLGTGNAHIQKLPCKLDTFHDSLIKFVSAAKFHSVAVSSRGEVYTWGFGRGGRLGHPDFDIHSGQAAVITPRLITSGLGSRRVKSIAAAKHHTVLATEGGEVFTWGSNREGQLGYPVDTQPTPRKVNSLRSRVIAVAAANKHTAVVSDSGEIYTWGCNKEGQLGYGTSNSASNYTPRVVDYLKNKVMSGVSAAKYHTVVLGADGEVYTWGHKMVIPKRVNVVRNLKKAGSVPLKFHRMKRLHVSSVAAGVAHSLALTDDGTLFYWVSADPDLKCRQLYYFCGKIVTNISAGKYWSAVVTNTGDVYMWDAKKDIDKPPSVTKVNGVKRATAVSVGEAHLMIISSLYHPLSLPKTSNNIHLEKRAVKDDVEELDESFAFEDIESSAEMHDTLKKSAPSLKSLCERVAMEVIVEPRNVIQMLEIADSLDAADLKRHCEDIAIHNLDYILTVSLQSFANASPELLIALEVLLDKRSSESWSHRRLPTPTATLPVVIDSEEEEETKSEIQKSCSSQSEKLAVKIDGSDSFLLPRDDPHQGISKQIRALRKKLQQIEMLEEKQSKGHLLDDQQLAKVHSRSVIVSSLAELGVEVESAHPSELPDSRGNKRTEANRKQKKGRKKMNESRVGELEKLPLLHNCVPLDISDPPATKEDASTTKLQSPEENCSSKKDIEISKSQIIPSAAPKKKMKKGGLSMFLSGGLENSAEELPPPITPIKAECAAWGGAKHMSKFSSLRDIQMEQSSNTKAALPSKLKDSAQHRNDDIDEGKFLLSSYINSTPIPVSANAPHAFDAERSTPPWASGTPPLLSRPSFRDIQIQQGKRHQSRSYSPKTSTAGFSIPSPSSPSELPGMNRWFKPEIEEPPSSIRNIQIEEKAMKDLKRFYTSVKLVRNPT